MTDKRPVFAPCSEKQRLFLTDNTTDIIVYGGGAGAGKSYNALVKQLEGIDDPGFRCVFIRQSRPQLVSPGALVDESREIYKWFNPRFRGDYLEYTFPSGARISFKQLGSDADLPSYDGTQFSRIVFDEAQNHTEAQVVYLLGRMRSKFKGKNQLILTCNPRSDSYLKSWVEWCLDDDGVPKAGTENVVRWFIRLNNKMIWGDSAEELKAKYPDAIPLSFRYIPAVVYDNPVLLKNNPGYLANLLSLSRIDQLRLLHGSWTARETAAGYFKREWVEVIDLPPVNVVSRVRAWDLASSVPSESNPDPDYTASVKISRDRFGVYYIEDVNRFRKRTSEVIESIVSEHHADGLDTTRCVVPRDPGAGGAHFNSYLVKVLAENGIYAKSCQVSGHSGKLQRFLPLCSLAQSGYLKVLKAEWNEEFFEELENFTGGRKGHDDMVDAASDAFNTLARELHMPVIDLPDFSKQDSIPRF